MAFSLVRVNCKLCLPLFKELSVKPSLVFHVRGAIGSLRSRGFQLQLSFISSKKAREEMHIQRPPPFPYDKKRYNYIRSIFDPTTKRFDDNTKVIVIDGNIAAGKTQFAKKLAEELDMKYIPEANMDMKYINEYGFDLRTLDPQLPEAAKSFDITKFYKDPNHLNVASFQFDMYVLRFELYVDALCHLLNTGQGVVLDRSPFSDFVFLETMVKFGYISRKARKVYYRLKENTIIELLKPHLIVYLDVSPAVCLERIEKRKQPQEVNSKVLTLEYLKQIEKVYKTEYLQEMNKHSEVLVFDWSEYGDVEVVVEDIERIDFDSYDKHDPKCHDWRIDDLWEWNDLRSKYTSYKDELMAFFNYVDLSAPELILSTPDAAIQETVYESAPGQAYIKGYNKDMGDKWILFKFKTKPRSSKI